MTIEQTFSNQINVTFTEQNNLQVSLTEYPIQSIITFASYNMINRFNFLVLLQG